MSGIGVLWTIASVIVTMVVVGIPSAGLLYLLLKVFDKLVMRGMDRSIVGLLFSITYALILFFVGGSVSYVILTTLLGLGGITIVSG